MKYFFDTEFIEGVNKPFFVKPYHTIDLISIGIVDEEGREYYAVSNEFDLKKAYAHDWVREHVLTPIFFEFALHDFHMVHYKDEWTYAGEQVTLEIFRRNEWVSDRKWFKKLLDKYGKSREELRQDIVHFVGGEFRGYGTLHPFVVSKLHPPVEFYGYYADYDWVVLCALFGAMVDLPNGFPMYARDLKQMLDEKADAMTVQDFNTLRNCDFDSCRFAPSALDTFKKRLEMLKVDNNYPKPNNEHHALADAKWNRKLHQFLQVLPALCTKTPQPAQQ